MSEKFGKLVRTPSLLKFIKGFNQMKNKITPKKILLNLDLIVTGTTMCVLVLVTFFGVVFRYALNRPFLWQEEIQLICIVWIVYGTAGVAFRMRSHVAIELLVELFPAKIKKIVHIFVGFVVLTTITYLFIQSIGYIQLFIMNERVSSILRIPFRYVYIIIPISCVLMFGNYVYSIFTSFREQKEQGNE